MSNSFWPHGLYSPYCPGQNTGVGNLSLLQVIFPTQGSNPGLPHCRQIVYQVSHKRSPGILEWVAYHFSSGSSWPWNQIGVSCIAGRFLSNRVSGNPNIMKNGSYLCINIEYLFFSFWLTSLCIKGSRFIHLYKTNSSSSLFMAE